jgi:hypothetical protein
MNGETDALYRASRKAILEVFHALEAHRNALTLVGAHALYQFTGASELAIVEFTSDADFTISAQIIAKEPHLEEALLAHGFERHRDVGRWVSPTGIPIDLMVPEAIAGPKRKSTSRSAVIEGHGRSIARRTKGLEGALVDRVWKTIRDLDDPSSKGIEVWIAGPAALLVAKCHKIFERLGHRDRLRDKDALDLFRLLQAVETDELAQRVNTLRNSELAGSVTKEAIEQFRVMFSERSAPGIAMAHRLGEEVDAGDFIATSFVLLAGELLRELDNFA